MKSWYESKTLWLGLATIVTAVVSAVAGWQQAVLAAVGAANIFLRTQTDKPVGKPDSPNERGEARFRARPSPVQPGDRSAGGPHARKWTLPDGWTCVI